MTWRFISETILEEIRKNKILFKDLEMLSETETEEYKRKREELIERLKAKGVKVTQRGNSIFQGNLSKGCKICKKGKWFCLFMVYKCTRKCFFCPMIRERPKEDKAVIEGFLIENSDHLVNLLKKWKIKGMGISGGEPLCMLERTLDFISSVREKMGSGFYIWLYTNGDLATEETLRKLKDAGLNEIRFDLSARDYDTKPIEHAKRIIDVVSVETPMIPEDEEKLKAILPELKKLGVDYVNLHELTFNKNNLEDMKKRGYKILVGSSETDFIRTIPVYGSELAALSIMEFALDNKIEIPVNFCSRYYKRHIQIPLKNKNFSNIVKKPHEIVTDSGFLEKIIIDEPTEKVNELIKILKSKGVEKDKIYFSSEINRFEFHPDLLKYIDIKKFKSAIILTQACLIHEGQYHDKYIKKLN